MLVKILMLAVFFSIMVGVGFFCRRHAGDAGGFVLGGRSVGPWLTAFAYGTSYFSAVIFVGYAGQFGWRFGIASTWIGIGNALIGSLLAWVLLGRRTRLLSQHLDSSTMPDFFGKRFKSPSLRTGAAIIVFVFLIPYTASLYNGLSRLFSMAFGVDYTLCIVLMALLTGIYVAAGGYMATAINDFIQGLIMLGGIAAVIAAVLRCNGGFLGSVAALAEVSDPAASAQPGVFASFFGAEPANLFAVVILTSLGTLGLPQMVQKFYAIKSEQAVRKGTVVSTIFALVVAGGCYFLGGFSRLFSTPERVAVEGYDSIIPDMLTGMPDWLTGIIIVLVLAASMSTLSSLVLTSSSTVALDLLKCRDKNQVRVMRILIFVFVAISAFIAVLQFRLNLGFIAQLMGLSWGALAGAFLAPFLFALYWRRTTAAACWASFGFGCGIMLANMFFKGAFPEVLRSSINCGAFAMLAGLVIVPAVSLLSKTPEKALVEEMFSCYERPVTVKVIKNLGE